MLMLVHYADWYSYPFPSWIPETVQQVWVVGPHLSWMKRHLVEKVRPGRWHGLLEQDVEWPDPLHFARAAFHVG